MQLKGNYKKIKRSDEQKLGSSGSQFGGRTAAGRAPYPAAAGSCLKPDPSPQPPSSLLLPQQRATEGNTEGERLDASLPQPRPQRAASGLPGGGRPAPRRWPTCSACSGKESVAPTTTLALASSFSARSMLATHCRGERNGALAARSPKRLTLPRGSGALPAAGSPLGAPSRQGSSAPLGGAPRLAPPRPRAYPVPGLEVPHALGPQRPSAPVHQHPARRGHARCLPAPVQLLLWPRRPAGPACACGLPPARGGRGAAAPGRRWRGGRVLPPPSPGPFRSRRRRRNPGASAESQSTRLPPRAQAPPPDFYLRKSPTRGSHGPSAPGPGSGRKPAAARRCWAAPLPTGPELQRWTVLPARQEYCQD